MEFAKYTNLCEYLENQSYPSNFTKQEKLILRRFSKKFEFDSKSKTLFYISKADKAKSKTDDCTTSNNSRKRRIVIEESEKEKIFQECHSSRFSGHMGRDNTLKKIKDRYYWPNFHADTLEMVRLYIKFIFVV